MTADYEKEHLARLRPHLAECAVLLKSDGSFPLEEPCEIAAYGSGVRCTVKGGTGSGEVNSRQFVTVEEGLKKAGFTVTSSEWLDGYDIIRTEAKKAFIRRLQAEAKAAKVNYIFYSMGKVIPEPEYSLPMKAAGETAIYVLSRISGEGNDRTPEQGDFRLTAGEKRDILFLNRRYKRFMLVLNTGGPVDLSEVQEVGNILVLSQLGVETGSALADILLGLENPSGKLAATWCSTEEIPSIGEFAEPEDTRYREGVYVGYRYFCSIGARPLYPFGFGLSYTEFDLKNENVTLTGSIVTASVTVTNKGDRPGKEVVQLYLGAPQGRLDKPARSLAAFAKTKELLPGESQTLKLSFDMCGQASYDEGAAAYVLEAGDYVLYAGNSSADTCAAACIRLGREVPVRQVRNAFGNPGFEDWKPETAHAPTLSGDIPQLMLDPASIVEEKPAYDTAEEIDDAVKPLKDEELAYLTVGRFVKNGGMFSVIGNASSHVAGAAGETTSMLLHCGIEPVVMADGPAGVRVSPTYYEDKKGAHSAGAAIPETFTTLLPPAKKLLVELLAGKRPIPRRAEVKTHYATALPVGTALAQSWNLDFARECGDIVGDEMERFGVHLWLAPALNIHRSLLCGRNFEYFSEDPLLSGLFAAAITNGVQEHPGCGVTIKHFAANNQETNRYGNSSNVSERALREIYLRGFEICVRESQPRALMTSYNLINGVHTSERRDLTQDVLRSEFGFNGIVMTDWVVGGSGPEAKYPGPQAHRVIAAGGDLFMPGSQADYENIVKGRKEETLSRRQLEISATRVLRMAACLLEERHVREKR